MWHVEDMYGNVVIECGLVDCGGYVGGSCEGWEIVEEVFEEWKGGGEVIRTGGYVIDLFGADSRLGVWGVDMIG